MPTYQYACTACDERLEAVQSFSDAPLTECPVCSGRLRKVFSAVGVVFKGSGFYKNDSRDSGKKKEPAGSGDKESAGAGKKEATGTGDKTSGSADKGSGSGSRSDGKGGSSGDSKPAAGAPAAKSDSARKPAAKTT